ncbi:hypothetical protein EPI10_020537 [Gossypium australe]|uniref:Uncharacterized protein n=1 Tax=Gossypium australe TaxID=47621 RepID=A0A5B6WG40_9ROSI|nr:hypothetical protein EPI10_020537 [Gossypium australe]
MEEIASSYFRKLFQRDDNTIMKEYCQELKSQIQKRGDMGSYIRIGPYKSSRRGWTSSNILPEMLADHWRGCL